VVFWNIRRRRRRNAQTPKPTDSPEDHGAIELKYSEFPERKAEQFECVELSAEQCECFASQIRDLSATPGFLEIHLPAARLTGYRLWGALRDKQILAILGARDAWSITWGDHVLIQDLISFRSQLGTYFPHIWFSFSPNSMDGATQRP
jgi:hypothetical protein